MNKLVVFSFIALTGGLAPALAWAGDTGCVWRALPESARATALNGYSTGKPEAFFNDVKPEVVGKAIVDCVALPQGERASNKIAETVGEALAAYIIQTGAEAHLKATLQIQSSALERAYGTIDPKQRRALADAYLNDKEGSKALSRTLVAAIATAYPDGDLEKLADEVFGEFVTYFAGRVIRERAEAKF